MRAEHPVILALCLAGMLLSTAAWSYAAEAPAAAAAEPAAPAEVKAAPEPAPAPAVPSLAERRQSAMARGVAALLKEQAADGSWGKPQGGVGITALCTEAILEAGQTIREPAVRRAVDYILKAVKPDGGIYDDVGLKIYSTSLSLAVLVKADSKAYAEPIKKATDFIEKSQWGADESIEKSDLKYGGFGYGKSNRPDMSNSQFALDALREAGVKPDSAVWQRAIVFVSRSQDRTESNDKAFAGTDSGGGIYSPVESKAEMIELPDGRKVFRTYGSMTYAILKAFVFANLSVEDGRVKGALDWIRKHWTFEENPELGQQGLYYYYMTAGRALAAYSAASHEDTIRDAARRVHDWRAELTQAILTRQKADGSWVNEKDRWFEGYPPVPTSYALMALAECR
ncbi:MAG TPA: prenyltransferase/squalene oxidase repeat-containing protein [Phycisphaerae bacterium]|nr:prenyltransferase/squalene oxidase repeat-containing protein [Phycisphaerae bacterium]